MNLVSVMSLFGFLKLFLSWKLYLLVLSQHEVSASVASERLGLSG